MVGGVSSSILVGQSFLCFDSRPGVSGDPAGEALEELLLEIDGEGWGGLVMEAAQRFSAVIHLRPVVLEHLAEIRLAVIGWGSTASLGAIDDHWRTSPRRSLSEISTYDWSMLKLCFFITTAAGGTSA